MKTTLGVGIAVLSALAARGKDFDRATLDAMLDRLAASPDPKIKPGPMACCYKMAEPRPVECRTSENVPLWQVGPEGRSL